jgi:hypothetical protein
LGAPLALYLRADQPFADLLLGRCRLPMIIPL